MSSHERTSPIYTPASGPPQGPRPAPEILGVLGESGVFELLASFYERLGKSDVAHLFPTTAEGLSAASERSACFFVQLLGGRPLFSERVGPPRMRARHLPFEIDAAARQTWLDCFFATLDETPALPEEHQQGFRDFLAPFSNWMVNAAPN